MKIIFHNINVSVNLLVGFFALNFLFLFIVRFFDNCALARVFFIK